LYHQNKIDLQQNSASQPYQNLHFLFLLFYFLFLLDVSHPIERSSVAIWIGALTIINPSPPFSPLHFHVPFPAAIPSVIHSHSCSILYSSTTLPTSPSQTAVLLLTLASPTSLSVPLLIPPNLPSPYPDCHSDFPFPPTAPHVTYPALSF